MSTFKHDSYRIWFIAVLALGLTSIIAQTIIIREFFNVFYGNELVIGLILANWMLFTGFQFEVDTYIKSLLYPGQEIVYQRDTPYGNLVVARQNEQLNFYENNVLLCSGQEVKASEETVHYAMTQHQCPVNVLLIGNGISGTLKEILKYDIDRLDYVERNPWIIRLAQRYTGTIDDKKVHVANRDARLYIKQTGNVYDVVILDIPEPVTAEMNRYYTLEFFRELKRCLARDAIVSFSLASTADYVSEEAASFYSVIYKTAKEMFEHVKIIPGGKNYFLCSDHGLTYRIPEIIEQKNIHTDHVNKYYMDTRLLKQRSEYILGQLDKDVPVNKDFKPVGYLLQLNYWLSYFKINYWIIISVVGIVVLLLLSLSVKNPVNTGLFFAGFTGSTLEIVLLLAFQIIHGYVYHVLGIVIMVFMGGLAVGAMYRKRFISPASSFNYSVLQFILGMYAILLPFILLLLKNYYVHPCLMHGVFFVLTFIASSLAGMIFNMASFQRKGDVAGISSDIYSVDLWGAAAGALLVSAFLVPVFGLIIVALIPGVLMLLSGMYSMLKGGF